MFYKTISFGVVKELFSEHFANFVVYKLSGKAELFVQYFGWGRISEVIYAVDFAVTSDQSFQSYL